MRPPRPPLLRLHGDLSDAVLYLLACSNTSEWGSVRNSAVCHRLQITPPFHRALPWCLHISGPRSKSVTEGASSRGWKPANSTGKAKACALAVERSRTRCPRVPLRHTRVKEVLAQESEERWFGFSSVTSVAFQE